jgi:predicted transcriptional regulator of viral defense system
MEHNFPSKTLGRQMAKVLTGLYDQGQTTFTLIDVERLTGLESRSASNLLRKAARRGLVSRLKSGLFVIVPPELGSSAEYAGNPYLVAERLAGDAPCFISHASAMELHRMVTQPQLTVFASSAKRIPNRTIEGTEFRFVLVKSDHFFGTTSLWITKQESVNVSDLERTIVDGLRQPEYCGGITEVAKGLWMRRQDIRWAVLVDYALRLRVGAVMRRLGYLLELYTLAPAAQVAKLQKALTATYASLDPTLPREGAHLARWRLQLNVTPDELQQVLKT